MNAKTQSAVIKHGEQLLAIFPNATERDPVKLCKKLRKLEREGEALGLRLCNGPEFKNEDGIDLVEARILIKVDAILNFTQEKIPVFVNRDPRGYALKIDDEWLRTIPTEAMRQRFSPLHRDWGGYGILAPDLTEDK